MKKKLCTKCDEWLPLDNFNNDKYKKDGLHSSCKECYKIPARDSKKRKKFLEEAYKLGIKDPKLCPMCKQIKDKSQFNKNRSQKDGLVNQCKECISIIAKSEKSKRQEKERREKNIEVARKKCREYYSKNKDNINKKRKEWRKNNKDKIRVSRKIYRKNNYQKVIASERKRTRERRALKNNLKESFTAKQERITFDVFNYRCHKCGSVENLCLDHFYPLIKGNILTPSNACILCSICNLEKGAKDPIDYFDFNVYISAIVKMNIARIINA